MNPIKQHLEKIKNITLSKKERTSLWSELHAYTEFKPIPRERISEMDRLPSMKPSFGFALFQKTKSMPILASLLIVSFLGGGTAFAAENAVPGDILYTVKTEINEPIRGTLALNAEAKANFEAWRAERRLNEARTLSVRSTLTEERREQLEERFDHHAERVEMRIESIAQTNPGLAAELSTKFEASLLAHEALLSDVDGTTTAQVRSAVRTKLNAVSELRTKASAQITVDVLEGDASIDRTEATKRLYVSAQQSLRTTKELYARVQNELTTEQTARVDAHFESTVEVFTRAENAYTNENYADAFVGFQKVVSAMNSLAVFLKTEISSEEQNDTRPIIRVREIDPEKPFPLPLPLPREIKPTEIPPIEIKGSVETGNTPPADQPTDDTQQGNTDSKGNGGIEIRL